MMNERELLIAQMLSNVTGALNDNPNKPSPALSALSGGLSAGASGFAIGGPVGGAIGLVGGGIAGAVSASNQRKATEAAERRFKASQDSMRLSNYPTNGVESSFTYYRNGGIMKKYADGGIRPIGSTGVKAVGPSHAEGGVSAGPGVEVEGGEVMHSTPNYDVWFSNNLKTEGGEPFAKAAEKLLRKKEKYEEAAKSKSATVKSTALRNLEKLNMELAQLTEMQMQLQQEKGLPIDGETDAVGVRRAESGATFSRIVPYLDNAVNLAATLATPAVPAPIYQGPVNLDTDYNVTDIVEGERRGLNQIRKDIDRNVSSSAIGRTNKLAAAASSIGRLNTVQGEKERIETQLNNQEQMVNYQTDARNIAQQNQFNLQKTARTDQMLSNFSANAANAVDDFVTQELEDRLRMKDLASLELLKKKYQDLGIWDRNMEGAFESFLAGNISYEEFIKAKNRTPTPDFAPLPTRPGGIGSKLGSNLRTEQLARQINFKNLF